MGAIEGSGLKLLVPLNGIAMEIRQGQPPCRPFTLIHAIYQNLSTRKGKCQGRDRRPLGKAVDRQVEVEAKVKAKSKRREV
jgi:hypothetical protein